MTLRERIKLGVSFVLAYLSTPTSKAGLIVMLTAALGKWLTPEQLEAVYWFLMFGAGLALVMWPERKP